MSIVDVLDRFHGVTKAGNGWSAHCPAHDDKNASLSITEGTDGRILLHCHAGCTFDAVTYAAGIDPRELVPPRQGPATLEPGRIVATYPYADESGALLFEVVRFEPKAFRQRRPDGAGGWVWRMGDVRRVLFRLSETLAAIKAGRTIYVTEGEKDALTLVLLALDATCNSGGADHWKASHSEALRGACVVIIADRDAAGRAHAAQVAGALDGNAASVRVIELPDRDGRPVKDAADWIAAGGTADELRALADAAPEWTPPEPAPAAPAASRVDVRDVIVLPGNGVSISDCAEQVFRRIAAARTWFNRSGVVCELVIDAAGMRLDVLRPHALRSRLEEHGRLMVWRTGRSGEQVLKPAVCPAETAEALLASAQAASILPTIRGLLACPVIVERGGAAVVLGRGYHPDHGGVLVTSDATVPDLSVTDGVAVLGELVAEFDFTTSGDRSRALAAFLTPALRSGGWLASSIAVDVAEADQSQSGKTYRQKVTAAVYGERPYVIALRGGGVGGVDESIAQALVVGRPFIQLDNVRGRLDSQYIEALATANGFFAARVPHRGEMLIDSRHFVLMVTSNGVETTRDLANRASIIRVRKRIGYRFRAYPEGDLLAHVERNHARYLGAVFTIIREWHRRGKPRSRETRHDFREWAGVLDWIVQEILGEAPLLGGHEAAQERVSNPAMSWLRQIALLVESAARLGEPLTASAIADLCTDHGMEIPNARHADETAQRKQTGVMLKRALGDAAEIELDRFIIRRTEGRKYYPELQQYKAVKTYEFTVAGSQPEQPEEPEQPHIGSGKRYHFSGSTGPSSGCSGDSEVADSATSPTPATVLPQSVAVAEGA